MIRNTPMTKMVWISFISIIIGTIAINSTLAIMNGTTDIVVKVLTSFDSDIKITNKNNKYFKYDCSVLETLEGIKTVNPILEEIAYAKYNGRSTVAHIKGMTNTKQIDSYIINTNPSSKSKCYLGLGIAHKLHVRLSNIIGGIEILIPKRNCVTSGIFNKIYNSGYICPSNIFSIEQRFDDNIIIVDINYLQQITKNEGMCSQIDIDLVDSKFKKEQIQQLLGDQYNVTTRAENQIMLTRALKIEKIFMIISLTIILMIALFNICFILSMIIMYKKNDVYIVSTLGCTKSLIRQCFTIWGTYIGILGTGIGTIMSIILISLQQHFGLLKMGTISALVDAYPVRISVSEYCIVAGIVIITSLFFSVVPAKMSQKYYCE